MKLIDDFLNQITMYRLVLYVLIFILSAALILSLFGLLPFSFISLAVSVTFLTGICWITNTLFAKVFEAHTNLESVYISALILSLIITPASSFHDFIFLFWAAVLAMASKYILAIGKKHIFNPSAFAVFLTGITIGSFASWWVGTGWMMPIVVLSGLLIVRKIQRSDMVFAFIFTSVVFILIAGAFSGENLLSVAQKIFLDTPILFFAFIMFTEPLTSPTTKKLQMIYAVLVGILFVPKIHIGSFYTTPEEALLIGNIFSYIVSPKEKLILGLKDKIQLAPDVYNFIFGLEGKISYIPGQYMEWTLGHKNPDSRGSRRYFTLASSPTEDTLQIGVKFYQNSSSWKKSLLAMEKNDKIIASQLSGEFNLPEDSSKKLAFIAGGIGITPFRSMIKYLIDTKQKRDIVLFYSAKTSPDFVYKEIFEKAKGLGVRTIYLATDSMGYLDQNKISAGAPDWKERLFYLSGPHSMVDAFEKTLKDMGISGTHIKVDFFPGYVG